MVETLRKPDIYDITVEFGNFRTLQMRRQNLSHKHATFQKHICQENFYTSSMARMTRSIYS